MTAAFSQYEIPHNYISLLKYLFFFLNKKPENLLFNTTVFYNYTILT